MALTLSGTNGVVGAGFTVDASGVSVTAGVGTFSSVQGSAASLTQIPAANIVGVCTSGFTKTGGFGKILQVQTQTIATSVSSANNTSQVDTGITKTITPLKAGSSIYVIPAVFAAFVTTSDNSNLFDLDLQRQVASGSFSSIHDFRQLGNESTRTASRISLRVIHCIPILDTPTYNLGDAITYKVMMSMYSSSWGMTITVNEGQSGGSQSNRQSTLTLMEIEA